MTSPLPRIEELSTAAKYENELGAWSESYPSWAHVIRLLDALATAVKALENMEYEYVLVQDVAAMRRVYYAAEDGG